MMVEMPSRIISSSPIGFHLWESLSKFATLTYEHDAAIWPIPLINVGKAIAVIAVIYAAKGCESVVLDWVYVTSHSHTAAHWSALTFEGQTKPE